MRSWVFSSALIAPVRAKRARPRARTGCCGRGAIQMARRRAAGRQVPAGRLRCRSRLPGRPGGATGPTGRTAECWRSVGCLPVEVPAGVFLVMVDAVGRWLGGCGYCFGAGEAELGGPALDVRPEPVPLAQAGFGRG